MQDFRRLAWEIAVKTPIVACALLLTAASTPSRAEIQNVHWIYSRVPGCYKLINANGENYGVIKRGRWHFVVSGPTCPRSFGGIPTRQAALVNPVGFVLRSGKYCDTVAGWCL